MEESQLVIGAATDAGSVRDRNQDLEYHGPLALPAGDDRDGYVMALADGMGGHERGDVAARMAIDTLVQRLESIDNPDSALILRQAFRSANELIYNDGSARGDEQIMGTTLVAALILDDDLTIANVGDSRAYLLRAGALTQVTEDHSLVAEQVKMGVLSENEARSSGNKNIVTRALGHQQRVGIDIYELTLLPKDRLLLTSDGIHDFLDERAIQDIVEKTEPEQAARDLVDRAIASGSTDNVTALCLWMAPLSALMPQEEPVAAGDRGSLIVPLVVAVGLALLIAIAVLVVMLG